MTQGQQQVFFQGFTGMKDLAGHCPRQPGVTTQLPCLEKQEGGLESSPGYFQPAMSGDKMMPVQLIFTAS